MKFVVNLVQLAVIAAIIFPMFYIWDKDKVDNFCVMVKPGMSKSDYILMGKDYGVKLLAPEEEGLAGGKWHAKAVTKNPFSSHSCQIKGIGDTVATAKLLD